MVKFAREHMQQGHFSLMWKDTAFNYAYFLWFEDMTVICSLFRKSVEKRKAIILFVFISNFVVTSAGYSD